MSPADEHVTIAEISSEPVNGFVGYRSLFTALVPKDHVDTVLAAPGGIGTVVQSWGPHPCVGSEGGYDASFWIDGPVGSATKYETIINSWLHHNKIVLLPDNGLLMCYGLIPRILKENSIAWDDPSKPIYDVLRVMPLSHYTVRSYTTGRIVIRREYLEDYLSLKGCVAIATYFEERYSSGDKSIDDLLGSERFADFDLPGRKLALRKIDSDLGDQLSEIWGCSLMLYPAHRPVSEAQDPVLTWPDREEPITPGDARVWSRSIEYAYIRDEVLVEYEDRDEFDVNPESGLVGYNGWWSVSYGHRYGRNHIVIELRKLYEGTPVYVIEHYNKFAVSREVAEKDRERFGSRHVGNRAKDAVYAFLQLTEAMAVFSESIGLAATQEDFGRFTAADVAYRGWRTFPSLRRLGNVAPLAMSHAGFLDRCSELFKLIEHLQPAPIRQMLVHMGIKREDIKDVQSLKLLSTACQLAVIADRNGFHIGRESEEVCLKWNPSIKLAEIEPLFALNSLRTVGAHASSMSTERFGKALEAFAIDETECRNGWGKALDKVYDTVTTSLKRTAQLVHRICV